MISLHYEDIHHFVFLYIICNVFFIYKNLEGLICVILIDFNKTCAVHVKNMF